MMPRHVGERMQFPFAHTSWFFAAYGVGLFYLFVSPDKVKSNKALIAAFVFFVVALFVGVVFTPFRAAETEARARDLIDIWAHGLTWSCVGASLLVLPWAVLELEFDPLNLGQGRRPATRERPTGRTPRRKEPSGRKKAVEESAAKADEPQPAVAPLDPGESDAGPIDPSDFSSGDDLTESDLSEDLEDKGLVKVDLESDAQEVPESEPKPAKRKKRR